MNVAYSSGAGQFEPASPGQVPTVRPVFTQSPTAQADPLLQAFEQFNCCCVPLTEPLEDGPKNQVVDPAERDTDTETAASDHYSLSPAERYAQLFTSIAGSWPAIWISTSACLSWASLNIMKTFSFDPYPFTLLNFFLSASAALTAPIILMSQVTDRKVTLARSRVKQAEELSQMNRLMAEVEPALTPSLENAPMMNAVKEQQRVCQELYDHNSQVKLEKRSEVITHKLGSYFGSWGFLGAMTSGIALWTGGNFIADYTGAHPIDPPPYLFLNLTLSFISAFSAPIVVMCQKYEDRFTSRTEFEFRRLEDLRRGLEAAITGR